jgi:hypothetical protein
MQKHKRLPRRRHRLRKRPSQPSPASEDSKQHKYENGAHPTNSLDERMSLVVGHWSLAVGHPEGKGPDSKCQLLSAAPRIHPALQDQDCGHLVDYLPPALD